MFHPPTGRRGSLRLKPFAVTAILAKEDNPPKGEIAIEWLLLSNILLNDKITCHDLIKWYLCRWQIEILFYILKSGCRVEQLQLTLEKRFLPCLAMYTIVAWRILMITQLARNRPDVTCEILFEKQEWQNAYIALNKQKPPTKPPSLLCMIINIAKLGGFLGRKNDNLPGPKTIWLGLKELKTFILSVETYKNVYG
jgi:hypothetical protein